MTVPAEVILKIIELTSIEPSWLLHGKGSKFRQGGLERRETGTTPAMTVGALLRDGVAAPGGPGPGRSPAVGRGRRVAQPVPGAPRWGRRRSTGPARRPATTRVAEDGVEPRSTHGADPRLCTPARNGSPPAARAAVIDIVGDAMAPVVADGASVAYSPQEETADQLHNKLVVVWLEGQPMVRWFQHCGRYALLHAENPDAIPRRS